MILSADSYKHLLKQGTTGPVSFRDLLLAMPQNENEELDMCRCEVELREVDF